MNDEIKELENGFTRHTSAVGSEIATARTKMSSNELKAFYQVSTLINKDDSEFQEYTISVKDFCTSLGLNDSNREYIVKLCKKLLRQVFEIEQENGDYMGYTIFSKMHYKHKQQEISMRFNQDMKPYLLNLKQFTKIENIEYIKQFNSKYAIRLYALLKDYRKMTYRDIDLKAFSKMLELPKSYENYARLQQKVLIPAIEEINEKSDLYISRLEEIKKERKKVLKIRLHFETQSEKKALDKVRYLYDFYLKNKEQWGYKCFIGCKYLPQGATRIQTITGIELEKHNNYHAILCDDNSEEVYFCFDGKTFLNRILHGVHNAIKLEAEKEKKQRLDLYDWQDEQDRIIAYKEVMNKWFEDYRKKKIERLKNL